MPTRRLSGEYSRGKVPKVVVNSRAYGPGKKISGIMPCTVIRPDDMADRTLDRDKHPQWQGETSHTLVERVEFVWERAHVREV